MNKPSQVVDELVTAIEQLLQIQIMKSFDKYFGLLIDSELMICRTS